MNCSPLGLKLVLPDFPLELEEQQQHDLGWLLNKFGDIFSQDEGDPGCTTLVEHEIHTTEPPI